VENLIRKVGLFPPHYITSLNQLLNSDEIYNKRIFKLAKIFNCFDCNSKILKGDVHKNDAIYL
jgi:hypothetical protein